MRRNTTRTLTPFAEALQDWMFEQQVRDRRQWSRKTLADALAVPHATVTSWFTRGTMPQADAFTAVLKLTGWPMERMLALTGYAEPPAETQNVWQFLRDYMQGWREFDAHDRAKVGEFLTGAHDAYVNQAPKRPPRRAQRPGKSATQTNEQQVTPIRGARETVSAGK